MLDFVNVINLRLYIALMRSIFLDRAFASAGIFCLSNVGSRNALKYCLRAKVSGLYGSSLVL
jgi:hypothetical protein